MSPQPIRRWDRETALLAWLTGCVSVYSLLFYFRRGELLLYGDAAAHINIARRVFDSRTPGLLQLGTVWLPLSHLLMVPFLLPTGMWVTGVGGSIPSMAAFVFGTLGIFRLVRSTLRFSANESVARIAPWCAAVIYAANPNLIYLQATAMTEALYLALFVWSQVHFTEFVQQAGDLNAPSRAAGPSSSLMKCGVCLAAACLTRYDGWLVAVAMGGGALVTVLGSRLEAKDKRKNLAGRPSLAKFILLAALGPTIWLAYNAIVYRNPLEFANGPYSAKAIEMRTPGASHPGSHDLPVAFSFFLKSAELNQAAGNWHRLWILLALVGTLLAARRRCLPLLLLWIPLPFYVLSIAYSGVPIFMPVWWPFSYYNVRYGIELLPAFAVFAALTFYFVAELVTTQAFRLGIAAVALIFVLTSYASIWHDPICFREAWINSRSRIALERELADFMRALPPDSTLLMYLGNHVGALQRAGIPLRRVINEGNHRTWKQPYDPQGLWEHALANPAQNADFVVAFDGDPVSTEAQKQDLFPLAVIHVAGQAKATIYQTHAAPTNPAQTAPR